MLQEFLASIVLKGYRKLDVAMNAFCYHRKWINEVSRVTPHKTLSLVQ